MLLMEPGSPAINCTTFNHNGNLLLAGGCDGIVRLFGKHDVIHYCHLISCDPRYIYSRVFTIMDGLSKWSSLLCKIQYG